MLVDFRVVPSLLDLASLQRNLSDSLKVNVDIVPKDGLRKRIGARILREAVEV